MLRWIWDKLFGKKHQPAADLFDPEETMIYTHLAGVAPDGSRVYARKDPLKLWHRVMEHAGQIDADFKVARSPSKAAGERYARLVGLLREIFEIKPLADGGLSDPMLLKLFGHFMEYTGQLKKNLPQTTTSVVATSSDTPSTSANVPAEGSPTPTTPVSVSTENGPPTSTPTPSDSGTASPPAG